MKKIRVFPSRTNATPCDENCRYGFPGLFDECDKIDISVTFKWDLPMAEKLYNEWKYVAETEIGGPATDAPGGEFIPGEHLKHGYVITSRGCPNKCWFCSVWKREKELKELKIKNGFNLLDDNLLACSDSHVEKVFSMLAKQKRKPVFSGGLEPKRLKDWHIDSLVKLKPERIYFAYDTADDYESLVEVGKKLNNTRLKGNNLCCYVLVGFVGDNFTKAEKRLLDTIKAGFFPYAMLYIDETGNYNRDWKSFQREWVRPEIVASKKKLLITR